MLRQIHAALVSNGVTRKRERRFTRWIKNCLGIPDAYGDLARIIHRHKPVAILDLGAFHGDTVVRFLDECKTPIHAFEPTPQSAEWLRRRFVRNPQVSIHQVALSNQTGNATFFLNANPQTNSLLDNDQGIKESFGEGTVHTSKYDVTTTTIDAWLAKNLPTGSIVVKADIQGAEGQLVDGGLEAFRNRIIAFYSEVQLSPMYMGQSDFAVLQKRMTTEFDFYLHQIYPCMSDAAGVAVQTDMLWIKRGY